MVLRCWRRSRRHVPRARCGLTQKNAETTGMVGLTATGNRSREMRRGWTYFGKVDESSRLLLNVKASAAGIDKILNAFDDQADAQLLKRTSAWRTSPIRGIDEAIQLRLHLRSRLSRAKSHPSIPTALLSDKAQKTCATKDVTGGKQKKCIYQPCP